ncbi:Nucleic acid-binding OB-fold [Penicillium malachiteum]|uniref:Nucleic acid-binding OB-fold n=1 Tax=Penicillium malachiteum TaxID=1324776 RepID=UPI002546C4C5|nr:Nucleic acid-binding OB-fold [Penicillium malachiteum]KAJ5737722.1 Nucleic acid-binding OB-fold [Penicillium malachiteum]
MWHNCFFGTHVLSSPFWAIFFSSVEDNRVVNATSVKKDEPDSKTISKWFARNSSHINNANTDKLALLSCMFPERRTDRVFWLQATSLARVIGRCLGLGSSRLSELEQWKKPGGPDLGQCVQNVMCQAENNIPVGREVLVEEIDEALGLIASRCRFSGPQVRRQHTSVDVDTVLSPLYRRLSSRDAKWLTRMILKTYLPVSLPERSTLAKIHFLLPHLLQFQSTFEGALQMLQSEPMCHFPPRPDPRSAASFCTIALDHLRPRTGIKIGRPEYFKARSIKHCVQMVGGRRMSIERKYDGEYCQIHIDLTNKQNQIQIFSKSGKDSTADRSGIMTTLGESLQIGTPECKFTHRCILEGELLVYSDKREGIADFHKLRKFLSRSGALIGVDSDSPPQPYEHLMIVFFDLLLLDDDVCLRKAHRERRLMLKDVVRSITGRAAIAEQEVIRFDGPDTYKRLEVAFSGAIARRWEGLVLKACDEPYFPIHSTGVDNSFGRWIKLKKDYIPGLGDTVDLTLIGGYYDAQDAAAFSPTRPIKWTHFLVACLMKKEDVLKSSTLPCFRVIDVVNRHCMHRSLIQHLNHFGEFFAHDPDDIDDFTIEYGNATLTRASKLFKRPFVVEMMGSGFEKPSGARYFTLRFPRVLKIHTDRSITDAASFRELQVLSEEARAVPTEDLSQEREYWCKRLKVGSRADQYIGQSAHSPSSDNSSSSTESESDGTSSPESPASTETDEKSFNPSLTNIRGHQNSSQKSTGGGTSYHMNRSPVVFLDDTATASNSEPPAPEAKVLTDNENLSQRSSHIQKNLTPQQAEECHSKSASSLISLHKAQATIEDEKPRKLSRKSPLTTIPVYTSGTSAKDQAVEKPDNTGLMQFLKSLDTPQSKASLLESNPHAASQGLSFGIILINPTETPLGQEINRTSKAISDAMANGICTSKGRIFFLDSLFLEQDFCPEDPKFCLRSTWSELGRKYYYACLKWGKSVSFDKTKSRHQVTSDHKYAKWASSLAVSFDRGEVLALGEY